MSGKIIDFEEERLRHGQLFGREDVLEKLGDLLIGPHPLPRGYVLLLGSPGVGKSAIVNQILNMLLGHTPHHFIRRGIEGWDRPEAVVENLCARMELLFPERVNADLPSEMRLADLLKRISKNHLVPLDRRLILVIDGLDEAASDGPGKNPLPSFLPRVLPPGVVILCASRPMYPYLEWLDQAAKVCRINLDDMAASNEAACRAFWHYHACRFSPPLDGSFIEEAVQCAAGNLLHAIRLRDWLEDLPEKQRVAVKIPRGLFGFLTQIWAELFRELDGARGELLKKGLAIACAAREALPEFLFGELINGPTRGDDEFLRAIRPFLREEPAHWHNGRPAYRLYHDYFRDFIANKLGDWAICTAHLRLAEALAAWQPEEPDPVRRAYALRHAVAHRLEGGDIEGARRLCADVRYLEAKCRALGVSALERDFEAVARSLGGDAALDLRAVLAAVSAEAARLCADPGALPVQVYNRLRCAGWKAERIAAVLHFDGSPPLLRLRHGVRLGPTRLRIFHGHDKPIVACVATPDGDHLLSASAVRTLRLWELGSGDCVAVLRGHDDELTACVLTPDGRTAISASTDTTVKLWDLPGRRCIDTLDNKGRWATTCALSPDGRRLVVGSDDGTITIWDHAARRRLATMAGHSDYVTACLVTPHGWLVSASRDQSVRVWDLESGQCVRALLRPEPAASPAPRGLEDDAWITALALLPDGRHILAAAGDGTIIRWDLLSGDCVRRFGTGQGRVDTCALLHEGRHLLCGMADGTIVVWDLDAEQRCLRFSAHEQAVSACAVTSDGRRVLSSSYDRSISIWELGGQESLASQDGHAQSVTACAVTPDGRIAVSASEDRTLKVWNVATGACLVTLEGHTDRVTACAISADGRRVLSGARDGGVLIWSLDSRRMDVAAGHQAAVSGCAITPDGRMITASQDGTLRIWDPAALHRPVELCGRGGSVDALAITPDGVHALAISFREGTAQLWDLVSGCSVRAPVGIAEALLSGAITPDGRHAVLGLSGGGLEVRDLQTQQLVRLIRGGDAQRVFGCAVLPDGARVISASEDGTLRIWSLETKQCLGTVYGTSWFRCVVAVKGCICAGDQEGNLWIIVEGAEVPGERSLQRLFTSRADLPAKDKSRLRDALARLYPLWKAAQRVAHDAGLDASRLDFTGNAREFWGSIIEEALKQYRLYDLVQIALKEYPEDPDLPR